jgi:excisionase family DNA binding protein
MDIKVHKRLQNNNNFDRMRSKEVSFLKPLLTTEQVSEILQILPKTVREYIRDGKLPASKFGKVWRVSEEDLEQFIERQRKGGVDNVNKPEGGNDR